MRFIFTGNKTINEDKNFIGDFVDDPDFSCQAVPTEPHYMEGIIPKMAECAKWAGAVGLRVDDPENIKAVKLAVDLPVIGIWKIGRGVKDVYLTPPSEYGRYASA